MKSKVISCCCSTARSQFVTKLFQDAKKVDCEDPGLDTSHFPRKKHDECHICIGLLTEPASSLLNDSEGVDWNGRLGMYGGTSGASTKAVETPPS